MTKRCNICGENKPLKKFHKHYNVNKAGVKIYHSSPKCRACDPTRNKAAMDRLREKDPDYFKRAKLKSKYGLTLERFNEMAKEQNHRCLLCRDEAPLVVDHNHDTKVVRGLLCSPCNMGIGLFGDDAKRITDAIEYLNAYK